MSSPLSCLAYFFRICHSVPVEVHLCGLPEVWTTIRRSLCPQWALCHYSKLWMEHEVRIVGIFHQDFRHPTLISLSTSCLSFWLVCYARREWCESRIHFCAHHSQGARQNSDSWNPLLVCKIISCAAHEVWFDAVLAFFSFLLFASCSDLRVASAHGQSCCIQGHFA